MEDPNAEERYIEELASDPLHATTAMRLKRTLAALRRNRFNTRIAAYAGDVPAVVEELLEEGATVAHGGSQTLYECGVMDLLKSGRYCYIEHSGKLSPEESWENDHAALSADYYLMSSNAITENGELYNVDGNGNRVAALSYGPKHVIVIAGANKIVRGLDEAVTRIKELAAPANAIRLACRTYCAQKGECVSLSEASPLLADGCSSSDRICCSYVVTAFQYNPGRVTVVLTQDSLGF